MAQALHWLLRRPILDQYECRASLVAYQPVFTTCKIQNINLAHVARPYNKHIILEIKYVSYYLKMTNLSISSMENVGVVV